MPDPNTQFQGQTLIIPDAYYVDNVTAATPTTPPTTPPVVFLGFAYGQKPQVPITYVNPQDLLNAIRGGPCSGFVPFLTNPSPQLFGAQQITLINVGENTQSHLTLFAGTSGVVAMTSANYGSPSNLLQAQVQTGTQAGRKVTIYDAFANVSQVGDNLGVPFKMAYVGAASGVTYSVTVSGQTALSLSTSSPNSGESVTINLANYQTVQDVAEYLNGTGFYSAVGLSSTNGQLPSSQLDSATTISLLPPSGTTVLYDNVTATLGDIVFWMNQFANTLVSGALASGVVTSIPALLPSNIPLTPFTGAVSIPPTLSDYASGFNVALTIPGWAVFADSNSNGVQALMEEHVAQASSITDGKWRRGFTGSSIGDSVNSAVVAAQSLDSIRMVYAYPGIYRTDTNTGQNVLYGGLYVAAAACGMAAGNAVATPLTNKALVGNGVEVGLTVSQINTLQQAGVMPIFKSPQTSVPTITSDMTTWQLDSNPENIFLQQVNCRDFLAYSMVNATRPYVGTIASPQNETNIRNAVKACLNALIYTPVNPNGVISSWDKQSLVLVYTGSNQTAAISVNVTLVGQNRFITIYVPIQPLNLVSTEAGTVAA